MLDWEDFIDEKHSEYLVEACWWMKLFISSSSIVDFSINLIQFAHHQDCELWKLKRDFTCLNKVDLPLAIPGIQKVLHLRYLRRLDDRIVDDCLLEWRECMIVQLLLKFVTGRGCLLYHLFLQLERELMAHKNFNTCFNNLDEGSSDLILVWIHHLNHVIFGDFEVELVLA